MKKKWWIFVGVLAALLLSLSCFGVRLRIAPRLVLSRALDNTIAQLDSRFEKSPVHLLANALDSQGRQQARLKLETEEKHLGPVVYDMTLQTQIGPNRIRADGAVITGGKFLDIQLFLDENFAALASQGLLEGRYYGITYETFSRDLRDRQLLTALLGLVLLAAGLIVVLAAASEETHDHDQCQGDCKNLLHFHFPPIFASLLSTLFSERENTVPIPCTRVTCPPCGDFLEYTTPMSFWGQKLLVLMILHECSCVNTNSFLVVVFYETSIKKSSFSSYFHIKPLFLNFLNSFLISFIAGSTLLKMIKSIA